MTDAGRPSWTEFEALAHTAPDAIVTVDAGDTILFVNDAVERIFGYTREFLLGQRLSVLMPARFRARHEAGFARYLRTGKRTIPWSAIPLVGLTHDGREIPLEISFGEYVDAQGRSVFSGFMRDMSERERVQAALDRSIEEQRVQAQILAAVEQGVITTDLSGRVTSWNEGAARLYGFTPEEALGRNLAELLGVPGDEPLPEAEMAAHRVRLGERVKYERLVRRRDGTQAWVSVNASPVRDANGTIIGLVGTSSDVSDRRRLEAQLRQAQKLDAVGRLAAGVAHDFNNLLTVINGNAEVLLMDLEGNDDAASAAREIIHASRRGAELTRQLLAFSRPEIGSMQRLEPNVVIEDLRAMLRRLLDARISLTLDLGTDVPAILADRTQVEQVIMNLVVNARDAMPAGGDIRIRTRRVLRSQPGVSRGVIPFAELSVEDQGIGMSPDTMARIFEPFFTTKGAGEGTGLGLATVYGIVKQAGGHIEVDSVLGTGSTFRVCLPAEAAAAGETGHTLRIA